MRTGEQGSGGSPDSEKFGDPVPLSSSLTVMIRTVLPAGWAILLPVALLLPVPDQFEPMKWFMSAGLVILLIEWAAWFARLKDVYADAEGLVISDRRGSVRVPWSEVADIRKTWWGKAQFARLKFRTPNRFGRSVLFMLTFEPFTAWNDQSAVRTVRDSMGPPSRSRVSEWRR
jgi:hypothetical protein